MSDLLNRRKPVSNLLKKIPCFSEISNLHLQFDMYCSTHLDDICMVLKYCYIQNLLRPITTHQQIQAFIQKHYFYTSSNIDFLLRYKASRYPVHKLEDSVQYQEIATMPVLGIKYRVYKWTETSWEINERFDMSGRAPVCYLLEYRSKFYILFTEVMTYIDQYDPQTGYRRYYDIPESYIIYAEQCLFYSNDKSIGFSPKRLIKEGWRDEKANFEDKVGYNEDTPATKKDSEISIEVLANLDRQNNIRDVRKRLFVDDSDSELDSIHSERRETSASSVASCRYNRRDKYFKENVKSAMNILMSKYISPKVLSTNGSVNFDSVFTSQGSSSPQLPKILCLTSASAKGYWNISKKACLSDSMSELPSRRSDSFQSSICETNSFSILESIECSESIEESAVSFESESNIEEKPSRIELKLRSARNECGNDCIII